MSIVDIKEGNFVSGNFTSEQYSCTVQYHVFTDDHSDGPDIVRRNPTFRLGRRYSFGNDRNPAATLKTVAIKAARRYKDQNYDSGAYYKVDCSFDTKSGGGKDEGGDNGGGGGDSPDTDEPIDPDPTDFKTGQVPASIEFLFQTHREVVNRAKWLDTYAVDSSNATKLGIPNSFKTYHGGAFVGPICNSAFQPKVPAAEREVATPVIRITGNITLKELTRVFPEIAAVQGKINEKDYTLMGPKIGADQFTRTFPEHSLKITGISVGKLADDFDSALTSLSIEFAVAFDLHRINDLDEGFARLADTGSFSARALNRNPEVEVLRDERGAPLQNPVLLNGLGDILTKSKVTGSELSNDVIYNQWIDTESLIDYGGISFLKPNFLF